MTSLEEMSSLDLETGLEIPEELNLRLQLELQRQLREQLEIQRKLQLQIEEQGMCLQMMFEKQCKACGDSLKLPSNVEDPSAQTSELMDQAETETNSTKKKRTEESSQQLDGKQKISPTQKPDVLKINTEGESLSPRSCKHAKAHDADTSSAK